LGLLHELVPAAVRVGLLVNPTSPPTEPVTKDVMRAASGSFRQRDSRETEAAFGTLVRSRVEALLVGPDALLLSRRLQIAILAARHAIPTVYNMREYPETGGLFRLMSAEAEADIRPPARDDPPTISGHCPGLPAGSQPQRPTC
jgi:putative ABC transport system substrate-binding protein